MAMHFEAPSADAGKTALSAMASTVTLITFRDDAGRPNGMTATAFAPASYEPLLALICVNQSARSYALIAASGRFGVNILSRDLIPVSDFCARPGTEKILDDAWLASGPADGAAPAVAGALSYFDCTVESETKAGEGAIIVGAVNSVGSGGDGLPLVFHVGRYCDVGAVIAS